MPKADIPVPDWLIDSSGLGILRAGLRALHRMDSQDLVQLIKSLEPVKTGRPAKK